MTTIFEAIENADYNLQNAQLPMQIEIGKEQLHNAYILLGKGYGINESIDQIVAEYGSIEDAPEKDDD